MTWEDYAIQMINVSVPMFGKESTKTGLGGPSDPSLPLRTEYSFRFSIVDPKGLSTVPQESSIVDPSLAVARDRTPSDGGSTIHPKLYD